MNCGKQAAEKVLRFYWSSGNATNQMEKLLTIHYI